MARIIPLGDQNDMLRQRMPEFDFSNPIKDPADLTATLLTTMKDNRGLGLAANQIGIPTRALAILTEPPEVLFNPKITYMSDEQENLNEGCLSYPGVYVKIWPLKSYSTKLITLMVLNILKELIQLTLKGLSASGKKCVEF
mgnify:CR=1 FL=1